MAKIEPVKRQLKNFTVLFTDNEEYQKRFLELSSMAKSEEWKFAMNILWNIKNGMAVELLSDPKFADLSPEEKDKIQTIYFNINEWISFLTNPTAWIGKYSRIQIAQKHLTKLFKGEGRTKPEKKE